MKTTDTRDMMLPTERSMPPVRMTHTWPRPTASRMATELRMVTALYSERKLGSPMVNPATRARNMAREMWIG